MIIETTKNKRNKGQPRGPLKFISQIYIDQNERKNLCSCQMALKFLRSAMLELDWNFLVFSNE
jgi:hypothetical protein